MGASPLNSLILNIQPETQDGKSIDHLIVLLTLRKTVLPHQERGNPAVLTLFLTLPLPIDRKNVLPHQERGNPAVSTSSSTSPSSIGSTSTSSSNVTPKQVVIKPSTLSPLSMLPVVSTTPPSLKKMQTFHKLPTNGLKSSMSIGVQKKLKF